MRLDEQRRNKEEELMNKCTFQPSINKVCSSLPPFTAENKPGPWVLVPSWSRFPVLVLVPVPGPSPAENNRVPGPGSPSLILAWD